MGWNVDTCCGISLEIGSTIWGVLNFLGSVGTFIFAIYVQANPELVKEVNEFGNEDNYESDANSRVLTTVIIISVVHFLASFSLSLGCFLKHSALLNVWLVYALLFGIYAIIDNFIDVFYKLGDYDAGGALGVLIQTVVIAVLWVYMLFVVKSYSSRLLAQEDNKPSIPEELRLDSN